MRRLGQTVFAMALWALPAALPSVALAGPPAELRQDIVSVGGKVTLGDLFYDAGDAAAVVAARAPSGQMVVLDATQVQILARSNGVDWGNPQGLRRIVVQAAASAPAPAAESRASVKAAAARAPLVLAYLRNLNAGDVVQAEDLTWSREAVGGADAPRQPEAIIGMTARRPLREGEAAALHEPSNPHGDATTALDIAAGLGGHRVIGFQPDAARAQADRGFARAGAAAADKAVVQFDSPHRL